MDPIPPQVVANRVVGKFTSLQLLCLATISFGFLKVVEVSGWTYHYSTTAQTWNQSYHWCKINFTDMVAIQNKEEISFLTQYLPGNGTHYWIGLRKINKIWVWIGTNKSLTKHEENWAQGEPNNKKNNQDCVEMYIRRPRDSGKWNDEQCERKKRALCYLGSCQCCNPQHFYHGKFLKRCSTLYCKSVSCNLFEELPTRFPWNPVSCKDSSCNKHGDCVETIENYTCKCWPGFYGANCEKAVSCRSLQSPSHGNMICSDTFGSFQYNSVCNFSCEEGFELTGARSLSCQDSGEWSRSIPICKAVSCRSLQSPSHGNMICSDTFGSFQYNSVCNFSCEEGFELTGARSLSCQDSGEWSTSIPICRAISCTALEDPAHGHMDCSDVFREYRLKSICEFTCEEGFKLKGSNSLLCENSEWSEPVPKCIAVPCEPLQSPEHGEVNCSDAFGEYKYKSICNITCEEGFELRGTSSLLCQDTGEWSEPTPTCLAHNVSLEKQTYTEAYVLTSLGLMLSGTSMAFGINYYRKKKNPGLLKTETDNANAFQNPTFEDNEGAFDL